MAHPQARGWGLNGRGQGLADREHRHEGAVYLEGTSVYLLVTMDDACHYPLCRRAVPPVLEREGLCPLHFLRKTDFECAEIRREAMTGIDGRRYEEINAFLSTRALALAQLATSGTRLRDDARPCLLTVFLSLLNVCERLARAAEPAPAGSGLAAIAHPLTAAVPAAQLNEAVPSAPSP